MSVISLDVLNQVKSLKQQAINSSDYANGYRYAMRALEAAIATMEGVNHITSNYTLNVTLEKR